jgi:hypothetical protein
MPSRHRSDAVNWFLLGLVIVGVFTLALLIGCASSEPPPCIPSVRVVPGPPEEITVVGGKLPVAPEPTLESLDPELWPDDRVRADPSGYEEALYSDLIEAYTGWANGARAATHHNAAFDEAWAEALRRLERIRSEQPDGG